jgi:hypothetical protein
MTERAKEVAIVAVWLQLDQFGRRVDDRRVIVQLQQNVHSPADGGCIAAAVLGKADERDGCFAPTAKLLQGLAEIRDGCLVAALSVQFVEGALHRFLANNGSRQREAQDRRRIIKLTGVGRRKLRRGEQDQPQNKTSREAVTIRSRTKPSKRFPTNSRLLDERGAQGVPVKEVSRVCTGRNLGRGLTN